MYSTLVYFQSLLHSSCYWNLSNICSFHHSCDSRPYKTPQISLDCEFQIEKIQFIVKNHRTNVSIARTRYCENPYIKKLSRFWRSLQIFKPMQTFHRTEIATFRHITVLSIISRFWRFRGFLRFQDFPRYQDRCHVLFLSFFFSCYQRF